MNDVLKRVSRSFYLTMRALPRPVRHPIGLAYLLARTSDTIADTELVPASERLAALQAFREHIRQGTTGLTLERFLPASGAGGGALSIQDKSCNPELILLWRCSELLGALNALPEPDRRMVREVLDTIISGQTLDLRRFAGAAAGNLIALDSDDQLDDYTYRVAGCVGVFWTRLCVHRLLGRSRIDASRLEELGVRFGKGLQLVNILRDIAVDLRNGRCYIPSDRLARAGLKPLQLLNPDVMPMFSPLYAEYLDRAGGFLADGWLYTNMLPRNHVRLRLACAWPILIGVRTIAMLRGANVLDPDRRVKVSRAEVRRLIAATVWCYPFGGAWERLFRRAQD
ncbi:MAG TPA: phytoene/squalene synthase family protein [Verrucomicrobiota bacterium]|nr:phytoene/squalene synthase family protein [Verrucomicrobiota bacterium]